MHHDLAAKLARVLTHYSQPVQPGQYVGIWMLNTATPLIEALVVEILARGGHPEVAALLPSTLELLLRHGSEEQLRWTGPASMAMVEQADIMYFAHASANTRALAPFPPERMGQMQVGRQPFLDTYRRRYGAGDMGWTITAWPTEGLAQQAEMGLLAYTDFVYRACGLDHDDPVAYWQDFSARQVRLVDWLADKKHAQVRGPGIDLSFDFAGRKWVNCDGRVNLPDGEIFTGPVEDSVNGYVEFNYPACYLQRQVEGVRLVFKDGVAVEASAQKDEGYLLQQLNADAGARRLGEFAIGTNSGIQQFTGSTLFDEKIGGTIHMALGFSIPESGGINQSGLHWDMVHGMQDGGEILIDGEPFYRSGEFLIA